MALAFAAPAAGCEPRKAPEQVGCCSHGPIPVASDQQESVGHLPWILLFRLLLVPAGHLAAGLSRDGSSPDHIQGGSVCLHALLRVRSQRTDRRMDNRPVGSK